MDTKKDKEQKFYHNSHIQLRFNDIDMFGHVNNTVYFSYFDLGKTDYFLKVCPTFNPEKEGIVIVHLETDFISQIHAMDQVSVQTKVIEIGNKSFTILQQVIDTDKNEIKCFCKTTLVAFDLKAQEAKVIPEEWKKAICAFEKKDVVKKK